MLSGLRHVVAGLLMRRPADKREEDWIWRTLSVSIEADLG